MFGKLMNSYFYGKSGKGDYTKDDLPTTRWQLFWEMLRVRLSAIVRLNLMYMLSWLPAMIVIVIGVMSLLTGVSGTEEAAVMDAANIQGVFLMTCVLLIPCILITGPFTAGTCYVTRNWARDEHAFIWSDFKDAVKENWKQSLVISAITAIMPAMMYICWTFYGQMAATQPLMTVPQTLTVILGLVWSLAVTYMYPMIVSYKMRLRDIIRNGLLLAIARLPMSVGIRLLHCVPFAIAFVVAYFFNALWAILGLFAYYLIIGFGLSRFVTASYTNGVFDKYINSRIEGAVVGRGLNPDPDVDDDDEDETPEYTEMTDIRDIVEARRRAEQQNKE